MTNKKKIIFIVIGIILLFLIIVSLVTYISFKNEDYKKLRSVSWTRMSDSYESTKLVDFPGDPMPNNSLIFYENEVSVCGYKRVNNKKNEELDEDDESYDGSECVEYKYTREDNKLIIDKNGKEVIYTFEILNDEELILTYSGDGFDFMFYYGAALG